MQTSTGKRGITAFVEFGYRAGRVQGIHRCKTVKEARHLAASIARVLGMYDGYKPTHYPVTRSQPSVTVFTDMARVTVSLADFNHKGEA